MTATGSTEVRSDHPKDRWDLFGLVSGGIGVLLLALSWALLLWKVPYTDGQVLLHYNIYFGVDLVGPWKQLLWMPLSGSVILLLNGSLVQWGGFTSFVRRIILVSTAALELVLLAATLFVVLLNISS